MMKKRLAKGAAVLLLLLALMPVLPGCNGGEADPVQGEEPPEDRELLQDVQDGQPAQEDGTSGERVLSKQELEQLFSGIREQDWEFADCVPFPDNVYDYAGAALFWDQGKCGVVFLEADGSFQRCSIDAGPEDELGLTYLGEGNISFFLEGEDGQPCGWTLSIQVDGENVMFKAQSEDGQQSPEEGLS